MRPFLSLLILLFAAPSARAASCCGGGMAAPAILNGESKAQLGAELAQEKILDTVGSDGLWRRRQNSSEQQRIQATAAFLLSDFWQVGAQSGFAKNFQQTALADSEIFLAYEWLPEWDYSVWKPRGVLALKSHFPTGHSVYEIQNSQDTLLSGSGFYSLGLFSFMQKSFQAWDAQFSLDLHRSFSRRFSAIAGGEQKLRPGWGSIIMLGMGYSLGDWRFGIALSPQYEQTPGDSFSRRISTAFSLSKMWGADWSSQLSYTNQRWLGSPLNTYLSAVYALQLQRRWLR